MERDGEALVSEMRIVLSRVDWLDERFRVRDFRNKKPLRDSLEEFGILQSPLLWEIRTGRFVILDGFHRLRWAVEKGLEDVWACVFPPESHEQDLWRVRIQALLWGQPLNVVQRADAVFRLHTVFPEPMVIQEFLPLLHIPMRPGSVASWSLLAQQDAQFLDGVVAGEISERVALELAGWVHDEKIILVGLLRQLQCSASIQQEIVERFTEVSLRDGIPRTTVFERAELADILGQPQWNHRRKTQAVRDALFALRFPRLKSREAAFRSWIAKAGLPPSVCINPPPSFEGSGWQVRIAFSSAAELRDRAMACHRLADSRAIDDMMGGNRSS